MAQAMVSAKRLSPSLAAWRVWDLALPLQAPPRLGLQIAQGSGHAIFEIHSDEGARIPLLARIRTQSTRSTEGGFHQEMAAWQAAADAELAPKLVYVDEENEVTICHKAHHPQLAVDAETLSRLCKQIYALPTAGPRLQLRSDINNYLGAMSATAKRAWRRAMLACNVDEALSLLEHDTPHFCHNDLTAGNLMSDDKQLMAIDWEYAALGSRYFDVAIAAGSLDSKERDRLIDIVFADTVDDTLVQAGRRVASLVTALWQTQFTPLEAPEPSAWASQPEMRA
ncbi:MAG: hypothetical protein CBC82_10755 [Cellvibrionales bacterium TMED122]|nr:hypothetical protein [Halieaceae bacterium]OUV58973.1 MAG: hypothetical protein CBC82_10755 [Cellvibrionales bacterium TMED122]